MLQWGDEIFLGDVVLEEKREKRVTPWPPGKLHRLYGLAKAIREMSKIGIRLLIKRGSLRVSRELLVETAGETSVLSWGFLRPESYSYDILRVPSFSGILHVA